MNKFWKYVCITFLMTFIFIICLNIKFVVAAEIFPFDGIITADALGVHSTDDFADSSTVTELAYGARVKVIGINSKGNRYIIKYDNDKTGYVASSYVNNVSVNTLTKDVAGIETYRSYCDSLISQGFIESYCPYLYYLHSKHPQWIFKADVVNKTIEEVASNQQWKNVLQSRNSNYWLSTNPIEGSYYYVNNYVISSFMDPRNSLFENTVFQFLDFQTSKDVVNDKALNKISGNTNLANYFSEFKDAAAKNGVNALHLMARSRQEGAGTVGYGSISGTYTTDKKYTNPDGRTFDGFYNFYNIGAYATSEYTTVGRGLAYAAGYLEDKGCYSVDGNGLSFYDTNKCKALSYQRPWNTPQLAISGGAEFISATYVKMGQNTNYFEKFNVSSLAKYDINTHQYMTNLYAPTSEGTTISSAYSLGGLFDSAFTFVIPVYKNMKDLPYQPVDRSHDATLKEIKVNDELISGFDSDVEEYNYNVITDKNYVDLTATLNDTRGKISGVGKLNFVNGVINANIVVTAEDTTTVKTYKVLIRKIEPTINITVDDIVNKMGVKVTDGVMYQISPGTVVNTLINTVTINQGDAVIKNVNGVVKTTGSLVTGDTITIKGTKETKTFTLAIRGDINGDGEINLADFVLIQSHILDKAKLSGYKFYAGDVNYNNEIKLDDFVLIQSHILKKSYL